MTSHQRCSVRSCIAVVALHVVYPACAGILETFDDGDATDGSPVAWDPVLPDFPGDYDASSGDYVLTPPPEGAPFEFLVALARDITAEDVSIRAQVRKSQMHPIDEEYVSILARLNPLDPTRPIDDYSVYDARLRRDGRLHIVRINPGGQVNTIIGPQDVKVPIDITEQDAVMQFDLFGNTLSLTAWLPGTPMPSTPQLTVTDIEFALGGIAIGASDGPGDSVGIFRWVHIAHDHVIRDGDATDDGRIDIDDINAIRNHFGAVGTADGTLPGDTVPFDGIVNIDDLNAVRNNFGVGTTAVPEPGACVLVCLGLALATFVRPRVVSGNQIVDGPMDPCN